MNDLLINLALFDGPAGAGDGAGAGGEAPASSNQGDNLNLPGSTRRGKSGDPKVLYGKQSVTTVTDSTGEAKPQAAAAEKEEVQVTSNTQEDRRKAYYDFVNGDYKDIYAADVQRIIDRRFSETKTLQARVDETQPIMDMLMSRYGITNGDMKQLATAIENDDAYWEEAADKAGMSVEQYKKYQKLLQENEQLKRLEEERRGKEFVDKQTQQWVQEAQAVKAKFPNFDFQSELNNPSFISMLKSGTPVEHAYKVIHFDELMGNAVNVTAANTQAAVVANVKARGIRPQENGTASQSAFTVKDDVRKLNKKDRANIAERALAGEYIEF